MHVLPFQRSAVIFSHSEITELDVCSLKLFHIEIADNKQKFKRTNFHSVQVNFTRNPIDMDNNGIASEKRLALAMSTVAKTNNQLNSVLCCCCCRRLIVVVVIVVIKNGSITIESSFGTFGWLSVIEWDTYNQWPNNKTCQFYGTYKILCPFHLNDVGDG